MQYAIYSFLIFTILLSLNTSGYSQKLIVNVEGLRSETGSIRMGFYESEEQWKSEKSNFQKSGTKHVIKEGKASYEFDNLKPGEYAIALADDENDNGIIDWGWVLPREGFGFSNYELKGIRKPRYEEFKFEIKPGDVTQVSIKVKYL